MSQRAPSLVSDTHYCVVGDVTIDATAAIASGVVLQASSGSRIVIGNGVCLAAGVCIQSRAGVLTIASGVSLGANVLVIGSGNIGANACVSPGSTLINPNVEANAILPPDTLVGDRSTANGHQSNGHQSNGHQSNGYQSNGYQSNGYQSNGYQSNGSNTFVAPGQVTYQTSGYDNSTNGLQSSYDPLSGASNGYNNSATPSSPSGANGSASLSLLSSYDRVYGREQVSQLISTLFPHRQPLNPERNPSSS
ncbi:MAG: hypothetical protein HC800_02500 [Phormidesmis sp. RL_2_1]|nr:hypothetical protein [Phormidesmis sp. RL_2_1]